MIPAAKFLVVRCADSGNVKSQCQAVDVVNDVSDAYLIQYLQLSFFAVQLAKPRPRYGKD